MSIEVISGSMFAGKTTELIRRVRAARLGGRKTMIFKPKCDNRYAANRVVTHDYDEEACVVIEHPSEIIQYMTGLDVVGIDEVQFFDEGIRLIVESLSLKGIRVIMAGLDMDWLQQPFGRIPELMAIADEVDKLKAICTKCGKPAKYSKRVIDYDGRVLVGTEQYEARCVKCLEE